MNKAHPSRGPERQRPSLTVTALLGSFVCGAIVSALVSCLLFAPSPFPLAHAVLRRRGPATARAQPSADATANATKDDGVRFCYPPLDSKLLQRHPVNVSVFDEPNRWMDSYLASFINAQHNGTGTDSVAAIVVLPGGTVYEAGFGPLRANESGAAAAGRATAMADSIYRMASVTKVFTALEALLLEQQGKLSMDDDVRDHVPDLALAGPSWRTTLGLDPSGSGSQNANASDYKITPLQLASQLSGLPRDEIVDQPWPLHVGLSVAAQMEMWANGTRKRVLDTLAKTPAVTAPWTYPVYSNMAFNLLGLVVTGAERQAACRRSSSGACSDGAPEFERMIHRDILSPLGMNSSFYRPPASALDRIAVPSTNAEWADLDVGAHDPSGGQYSSARDLGRFLRSLIRPNGGSAAEEDDLAPFVLPPAAIRKWLSPLFVWNDDLTAVGAPWEIKTFVDDGGEDKQRWGSNNGTNGRATTLFTKDGNFPGYYDLIVIDPAREYAFALLTTGANAVIQEMGVEISKRYGPAVDAAREAILRDTYAGRYTAKSLGSSSSSSSNSSADEMEIVVGQGSLWMSKLVINGTDWMTTNKLGERIPGAATATNGLPLWPTNEADMYRFQITAGPPSAAAWQGCTPQWVTNDAIYAGDGFPFDLVAIRDGVAQIPSARLRLVKEECTSSCSVL